jgi:hemin uptake protein HemP
MKRGLLLLLAVLLAGCAQVPTSGPIVDVEQPVTEVDPGSFVRVLARPPQPGMSQMEIVQGFLDAASGFEDAHAVAEQYLTPSEADQWNPAVGVRVYANDTEALTNPSDGLVDLTGVQAGFISSRAQYIQSPPDTALSVRFELQKVGAEWRISGAPAGLLLSRAAVERSYREFQTYFVALPGGILAPNPVLFTSSQRDVSSDLVRSLLSGPSRWLQPAVRNAFPPGTRLNSVLNADGVARVDLSSEILQADDVTREQMSAQLVWTLRQVPGIRSVVISADGQPFAVPGAETEQPRTAWADYDPDGLPADATYYLSRAGAVLYVDPASIAVPVAGAAGTGQPRVRDPLISLDQTAVAATSDEDGLLTAQLEGDGRWRSGPVSEGTRGGSWDRTGLLWLPADDGIEVVNILGARASSVALPAISSVQISRDGSRAVVISDGALYLLRVDRAGRVPRLVSPRLLSAGPVVATGWASANTVVMLLKPPEQPAQVVTVDLSLLALGYLGGPPQARSVAAAPDRPFLSGTADGQIWSFNGATWIPAVAGRQPRYPG